MNRSKVLMELHAMIDARLFDVHSWRGSKETNDATNRKLQRMGLEERVPGKIDSTRATAFGKEQNIDLIMVFIGLWAEWDMAVTLEKFGLINEQEYERILDQLEAGDDPERVMLFFARRAYFEFYNPSRLLN